MKIHIADRRNKLVSRCGMKLYVDGDCMIPHVDLDDRLLVCVHWSSAAPYRRLAGHPWDAATCLRCKQLEPKEVPDGLAGLP